MLNGNATLMDALAKRVWKMMMLFYMEDFDLQLMGRNQWFSFFNQLRLCGEQRLYVEPAELLLEERQQTSTRTEIEHSNCKKRLVIPLL